ncbi:family 78 glycoside hydrolase catalytic domain [Paenibacillus sp. GCM10027626]|uniref:family 78 glycoside hydrolase catalytic domain n=1 Tax=Paenibacillus sp. GCM10027626 TaxID=3273411 RepID=UPI003637D449
MHSLKPKSSPFTGEAMWIWGQGGFWQNDFNPGSPFRTCYFRKSFHVPAEGGKLTVHISADSRYTLFINGSRVCSGPAKGDIAHQFYDTVVLDPWLKPGENIISVVVICFATAHPNYSEFGVPLSIMTATPAFILDGSLTDREGVRQLAALHTNGSWSSLPDRAYSHHRAADVPGIVSGLGEDLDYGQYPEGWQCDADARTGDWRPSVELAVGVTGKSFTDTPLPYRLVPRMIPLLREESRRFASVYESSSLQRDEAERWVLDGSTITVGPGQTVSLIVDAGELTTGYPVLTFGGGSRATVMLTYSEALHKDGRKRVEKVPQGGTVEGLHDSFRCDGKDHSYEPMHWRTFRYIQIDISSGDEALLLRDLGYRFVGYPLELKAKFASSDERHSKLWDMTFRTLQLCCHDTFEDCPYYEQNQYAGDSQVVALVAGYMTGDWQLTRQAVLMFNWSADYEGITKSRYPNRVPQIIPSWSLLWIVMVYEYWWHTGDLETADACKKVMISTLDWFQSYLNDRYLLENLDYWTVVDWVKEWNDPPGAPPGSRSGETGLITAQYSYSLKLAASLLAVLGHPELAERYSRLHSKTTEGINQRCWDEGKGLYRDCPQLETYSELGNAWPILAGCATAERAAAICDQFNRNEALAKATLYGRYYVFRALERGERYGKFAELLDWWYLMMDSDLTTWPEEPWLARSFCHAWSCSPGYEFLSGILGVKPAAPGFREIRIEPQDCGLAWAKGSVPTPYGAVEVAWEIVQGRMQVEVKAPEEVKYTVVLPKTRR